MRIAIIVFAGRRDRRFRRPARPSARNALAASAGIMAGRPATTHHAALDRLRDSGAEVIEARVVDDGDLVSSGGVTCGIDLALWLVEREFNEPLADAVAADMEYARSAAVRPSTGADRQGAA